MTRHHLRTVRDTASAWTSGSLPYADLSNSAFDTMFGTYAGWLDQANRLQAEVSHFIGNRFERDVEMLKKFGTCKKPEHFFVLQSEFTNDMISDYLEESKRLLDLFNDGRLTDVEVDTDVARRPSSTKKIH